MKKIVLTGGPSSGKSSIIEELRRRGYYVVLESALYSIEYANKTNDNIFPWTKFTEFQKRVINFQKQHELEIPEQIKVAILDRCLVDTIAYYKHEGLPVPSEVIEDAKKAGYDKVLLIDMLPEQFYWKTRSGNPRAQSKNYENACKIHKAIKETYESMGIPLIHIPVIIPVENRADYVQKILSEISDK